MSEESKRATQWKPGQSGNAGGQPKGVVREARERHKDDLPRVLEIWFRLALGEMVPGYENVKAKDRISAGQAALDRLLGKPKQSVDVTGDMHVSGPAAAMRPLSDEQLAAIALVDEGLGDDAGDHD